MRNYLILFILITGSTLFAQKQKLPKHRSVQLYVNNQEVQANVLRENKSIHPQATSTYYWYYNNEIKTNQGGYKGNLLDGDYRVMNSKGNMMEQGNFLLGTPHGIWKKWNTQGELLSTYTWRKGVKNGWYKLYKKGRLVEKGTYKKGRLHGYLVTYEADSVATKVRYKNGEVVPEKEKKVKAEENNKEGKKQGWKFWKKKTDEEKSAVEKPEKTKKPKEKKSKEKTKKETTQKNKEPRKKKVKDD